MAFEYGDALDFCLNPCKVQRQMERSHILLRNYQNRHCQLGLLMGNLMGVAES